MQSSKRRAVETPTLVVIPRLLMACDQLSDNLPKPSQTELPKGRRAREERKRNRLPTTRGYLLILMNQNYSTPGRRSVL